MRWEKILLASMVSVSVSGCLTQNSLVSSGLVSAPLQDDASPAITMRRAGDLEKRGDWPGAFELYKAALKRKPTDKELLGAHAGFMKRRDVFLSQLEVEMLIAEAEWLKRQKVYQEAARGGVGQVSGEGRIIGIAESLAKTGEAALARNDIRLAKRALPFAVKLHPNSVTEAAHQKMLAQMKQGRVAKRQRQAGVSVNSSVAQK